MPNDPTQGPRNIDPPPAIIELETQRPAVTRLFGVPIDLIGLVLGPLVMLLWIQFGRDAHAAAQPGALSIEAHRLAGIMMLTVIWWLTEPIPIPATGLLAVSLSVIFGANPQRAGEGTALALKTVLQPFADPSLFFLLGGMFIGRAMTRHGLDQRFALSILCSNWAGRSTGTVLFAVGLAVALVSMFVSNTAATAMVYPVTMGLIAVMAQGSALGNTQPGGFARSPYASALLLMTAYASSVGGIATPIGTTTNVVAMGFFKQPEYFGRSVDFARWTFVGIPLMGVLFVGLFFWLRWKLPAERVDMGRLRDYLQTKKLEQRRWNQGEINTLIVFVSVVSMWIAPAILSIQGLDRWINSVSGLNLDLPEDFSRHFPEEIVALLIPVMLYLLPVNWRRREFTLDGGDLLRIDWGTMLLFGSGLALGSLMFRTGLAAAIADATVQGLDTNNLWVITALSITAGIVLSEFTSNAASATTLIPVVWQLADKSGIDPLPPLMGLTFGASFGSALPVSTPPNAIVYGSGLIPMRRMIGAGIVFDVVCGVAIWCVLRVAFRYEWTPFLDP